MLKKALTYSLILNACCICAMHETEYQLTPKNFSVITIKEKQEKDSLLIKAILENNITKIQRQLEKYTIADVRILRLLTNITYRAHFNYIATLLFARIEQLVYNNNTVSIIERDNLATDVLLPENPIFAQDIAAIDAIKNKDCEKLRDLYQENFDIDSRIIKIASIVQNQLQLS